MQDCAGIAPAWQLQYLAKVLAESSSLISSAIGFHMHKSPSIAMDFLLSGGVDIADIGAHH